MVHEKNLGSLKDYKNSYIKKAAENYALAAALSKYDTNIEVPNVAKDTELRDAVKVYYEEHLDFAAKYMKKNK